MLDQHSISENLPDFKLVFESLPGNFLVLRAESPYNILAANQNLLFLLDRDAHDVIGESIIDFYRSNTREANLVHLENTIRQVAEQRKDGEVLVSRYKALHSGDPAERFWKAETKPVLDESGELLFIIHVLHCLSTYSETGISAGHQAPPPLQTLQRGEKRSNEAVWKSEQNLRNLILQAPFAICIFRGPDYIIEIANDLMLKSWDKNAEEVLNRPVYDALPEARGQGFEDLLYSVYTTGNTITAFGVAGTLIRNGAMETYYVDLVYQALREEDGRISGIMIINIDVTEQIQTRKKIEEAEERARLAVESAELGTFEVNLLSNEFFASSRTEKIFEVETGAGRGRYISAVHPDDLSARKIAYDRAKTSGVLEYEARIIGKDGRLRWIRVKGKLYYNQHHEPSRLIGVVQDISVEKETNRQKDDFISLVSHELKTPITSLKGYTQLLARKFNALKDEKASEMLDKMDQQVKRLHYIVQDLLDVSRIESNKIRFRIEEFSFNDLVTQTVEEVQRTADTHRIVLLRNKHALISADKERTSQVLINLLTNALNYSPNASEIHVSAYVEESKVVCSVKDFGQGIEKSKQSKIFERFYQAGDVNKYNAGLGLGLFISAEIIQRQNGQIWLESEWGKGATFFFSLPM